MTQAWPDYCCVPAFFHEGASVLGAELGDRRALAVSLGVHVPFGEPNPWSFPIADELNPAGVTISRVRATWPSVSRAQGVDLAFGFTPLSGFVTDPAAWVVSQLQSSYVGVGLDYATLFREHAKSPTLHVLRVVSVADGKYALTDPSHPGWPVRHWGENRLFEAVESAADGFWTLTREGDS